MPSTTVVKDLQPYLAKTGFLHWEGPFCPSPLAIPCKENVLLSVAYFQEGTKEAHLQGQAHLQKLLPFQTEEGSFPKYLHTYPYAFSDPIVERAVVWIESHASLFFTSSFRSSWQKFYAKFPKKNLPLDEELESFYQTQPFETLEKRKERLASGQQLPWTPHYLPLLLEVVPSTIKPYPSFRWGSFGRSIDLCAVSKKAEVKQEKSGLTLQFDPTPWEEDRKHAYEAHLYVNRMPKVQFFANGGRTTLFFPKDTLEIRTEEQILSLTFSSDFTWLGHIGLGNRPSQQVSDGVAYDYVLSFQTIQRGSGGQLRIECSTSF